MKRITNKLKDEWKNIGRPFINYTAAQTAFNATAITASNGGDLYSGAEDSVINLPFFAGVNLGYAKCVDTITRKMGKYGRLGANAFSLGVSGAFYTYALLTNDNDPTIPALLAGAIGLTLTNKQVNQIQREGLEEKIENLL